MGFFFLVLYLTFNLIKQVIKNKGFLAGNRSYFGHTSGRNINVQSKQKEKQEVDQDYFIKQVFFPTTPVSVQLVEMFSFISADIALLDLGVRSLI